MACTIPMRVLISALVAIIVILVAAVTLALTYSVALTSLRDVAEKYAVSLVQAATTSTELFLNEPQVDLELIASNMKMPGVQLPIEQDPLTWHHRYTDLYTGITLRSNQSYGIAITVFHDGSAFSSHNFDGTLTFVLHASHVATVNPSAPGSLALNWFRKVDRATRRSSESNAPFPEAPLPYRGDVRVGAYLELKAAIAQLNLGTEAKFWGPPLVWRPGGQVGFLLMAIRQVVNASGYPVGLTSLGKDIRHISDFLRSIKTDPDANAFAINGNGQIIAATLDNPPYFTATESATPLAPSGCASTVGTDLFPETSFLHVCFKTPSALGYAPLAAASNSLLRTRTREAALVKSSAGSYYVVSSRVASTYALLDLNVVLVMPESLVTGDVVTGRNQAIGIVAALVVVTSALSFLLVYLLLLPLTKVSRQMHETARLRDFEGEDEDISYSALSEVHDLQKSYYNMHAAIQSFTRYVPKDVVTDLMASGQMCEIKMDTMRCTLLFTDIQGFTTICERVPVEQLSRLVSEYFDAMSKIVMGHDGLIDKYIGDCIMAVWGAPFPLANQEFKATLAGLLLNRETLVDPICGAFDEVGEVLALRVGLNTGDVLAGNMGSSQRMNYTVIGEAVNLASTLEALNKKFGTRVMISEETAGALGNLFCLRQLLPISGAHAQRIKIYDVVGIAPSIPDYDRQKLRERDENFGVETSEATQESDRVSRLSNIKYLKASGRVRHDSVGLLAAAQGLQEKSVVATEAEHHFAMLQNDAVNAFAAQNCADALEVVNQMSLTFSADWLGQRSQLVVASRSLTPPTTALSPGPRVSPRAATAHAMSEARSNVAVDRAIELLCDEAEKAIADPSAFTGVISAN